MTINEEALKEVKNIFCVERFDGHTYCGERKFGEKFHSFEEAFRVMQTSKNLFACPKCYLSYLNDNYLKQMLKEIQSK